MKLKLKLVRIGNSQGIRIPKPLIEQTGLGAEVEVEVVGDKLVISPVRAARAGWDEALGAMARAGDDELALGEEPLPTDWERGEWKW